MERSMVTETEKPMVTEMERPKVTETEKPMVTEMERPKVTETERPKAKVMELVMREPRLKMKIRGKPMEKLTGLESEKEILSVIVIMSAPPGVWARFALRHFYVPARSSTQNQG
jgi:hypothetical protein